MATIDLVKISGSVRSQTPSKTAMLICQADDCWAPCIAALKAIDAEPDETVAVTREASVKAWKMIAGIIASGLHVVGCPTIRQCNGDWLHLTFSYQSDMVFTTTFQINYRGDYTCFTTRDR